MYSEAGGWLDPQIALCNGVHGLKYHVTLTLKQPTEGLGSPQQKSTPIIRGAKHQLLSLFSSSRSGDHDNQQVD